MEATQGETGTESDIDDIMSSSDFRNICSYSSFQGHISDVYTSLQTLAALPEFDRHIREEAILSKMGNIDSEFVSRKTDLMKTDCSVVIAGETSAGKSSVINLIIGEEILPTDTLVTTSRICRLRYSKKLQISTCDRGDKQIQVTGFDDKQKMAEELSRLATTDDDNIKYVDVWLPVQILKGNVLIVDTPGIGDQKQEEVAGMMMDYIPNALAFVFVVNVASAGGLQEDRLVRILKHVEESLHQMHSFDPSDAIFLLNKWDSVVTKKRKTDLFEEMKQKVHNIWETVDDKNILKFSAAMVEEHTVYQREFDKFQQIFKSIIAKNENKRIKVHIEYIRAFIVECDTVVTGKINVAKQNTQQNDQTFARLEREFKDADRKWNEAFQNIRQHIDEFLEEMTKALKEYIQSEEFKLQILQGLDKYENFRIESQMDSRIKNAILYWQKDKIEEMFKKIVMDKITERLFNIHQLLHNITDKLKGFTSPFDVKKIAPPVLVRFVLPSTPVILASIPLALASFPAAIAVGVTGVVAGLVYSGARVFHVLEDTGKVIENEYKARIKRLTSSEIRRSLTNQYAKILKHTIENFLNNDLKAEIDNLKRTVASMKMDVEYFRKEESNLISLKSEISRIEKRLKVLENTDVQHD